MLFRSAFPKVLEALEQREGRESFAAGNQSPIYDFSGFQLAWPLMALSGFLLLISVDLISTLPAVFIDNYVTYISPGINKSVRSAYRLGLILSTNWPVMIFCAYLLGRWIGTRCSRRGIIAVLLAIGSTAIMLTYDLLSPDEDELEPSEMVLDLLRFPFLIGAGLIGYWRGQKYRLSRYLHYLMKVLPLETRDTVIQLAFEEAQKVASPNGH